MKTSRNQIMLRRSHQRNKHLGAPPTVRYIRLLFKLKIEELRKKDQRTRNLSMHNALPPRNYIDSFHVSRSRKRTLEDLSSMDTSIRGVEDYIKKERRNTNFNSQNSGDSKGQTEQELLENWNGKKIFARVFQVTKWQKLPWENHRD